MPAADDREVAFTYGQQHLVLLDGAGREQWQAARPGLRDVAPRLGADRIVAATEEGLAAFRRADGTKLWDTSLGERANTPVVVGGLAVTSTWEGSVVAVDLAGGAVAWKSAPAGPVDRPSGHRRHGGRRHVGKRRAAHRRGAIAVDGATGRGGGRYRFRAGVSAPPPSPREVGGGGRRRPCRPGPGPNHGGGALAHAAGGGRLPRDPTGGRRRGVGAGRPPARRARPARRHQRRRPWRVTTDGAAVRGGPVVGPGGSFAFPLDDGRMVLAGPDRPFETRQAPGRISGLAAGPGGLLIGATRGAEINAVEATGDW